MIDTSDSDNRSDDRLVDDRSAAYRTSTTPDHNLLGYEDDDIKPDSLPDEDLVGSECDSTDDPLDQDFAEWEYDSGEEDDMLNLEEMQQELEDMMGPDDRLLFKTRAYYHISQS